MKDVHLQHLAKDGKLIEATFSPSRGMNLLSFKKDGFEFLDPHTEEDFNKRFAGLGALIGPHFYHRKKELIAPLDPKDFPFVKNIESQNGKDPLSHGIGRYSSWNFEETSTSTTGHLSGLDAPHGKTLACIQGFPFLLDFSCKLTNTGLEITYHVKSEKEPSTIGLHYYLALPDKKGSVLISSDETYNDMGDWKKIPKKWLDHEDNVCFNLKEASDFGFRKDTKDNSGWAVLVTPTHSLKISYKAKSSEHAFQLYHPKDSTFVCIEPVSARDPRDPRGMEHKLSISIDIL